MSVVGVVGAGTIGQGVALSLAMAGHDVVLVDLDTEVLDRAMEQMRRSLRGYRLVRPAELHGDTAGALGRINPTPRIEALAEAGFVVENAVEDFEVKRDVFTTLDRVCPPDAYFAANTSVIAITAIAAFTRRPEQVIGMHFMNPVPLKRTVEVVRGEHTSETALLRAEELLASMGKRSIVVADSPGFVSNRILMLAVNEAAFLVFEGVASAESVDAVMVQCFEHRMGLLETADLIGLDTVLRSIRGLWSQYGDSKYRPCPMLVHMVNAGYLGRKSGRGFYVYDTTIAPA